MTNTQPTTHAPMVGAEQIALVERLCNASGVSGDEREVRAIVLEQIRPKGKPALADEIQVDPLGSVYAIRHARKTGNPLRVLLDAHMDEVGFLIVSDEEGGLFRFTKIGGVDDRTMPGKMVLVGKENTPGVIGAKAVHLLEPGEMENRISLDALRIDIGPNGKAKIGERASYATRFKEVGPSFMGKALDDRLGCAALIEILRAANSSPALDHLELLFSWSVQEEIGGYRGARVAAYSLNPEVAFALDVTPANDLPMYDLTENTVYNTRLGAGPAIYLADASNLGDPRLARHLMRTGDELGIPYQIRQAGGGGTDAGGIHRARSGIPTISVSVPGRYLHTAASIARRADWENELSLVWNALARLERPVIEGERA